ncbi:MAG: 50S ribosome-binding GTPase, partial [Candidatus Omnitrophica bacterium]|nr:50S ribosome-binding GTPase [Candidatus Omnitrophota bacterium]
IRGIPVRITDTAGILRPRNLIEKKAVERSQRYIVRADVVLLVFDGSRRISTEDIVLIKKLKKKKVIALINKMDLPQKIERDALKKYFERVIPISAKKMRNITLLEEALVAIIHGGQVTQPEPLVVTNLRHIEALRQAERNIAQSIRSSDDRLSGEFIAEDIVQAMRKLDVLLGKDFSDDLLDKIFSRFCIGK